MKTYVTQSDAEAKGLQEGTVTELVVPIDPQPDLSVLKDPRMPVEFRVCPILGPSHRPPTWGLYGKSDRPSAVPIYGYEAPYRPGDRIAVKEATRRQTVCVVLCESVDARPIEGPWCWVVQVRREL